MSHNCSSLPATVEKGESIPNRGTFHSLPGQAASHITSSLQKRLKIGLGLLKQFSKRQNHHPAVPKREEKTPNAAINQPKAVRKVSVFPLLTDTQPPARSTTTAQALPLALPPRPERRAHCQGRASILHRARTPSGHYCSPRACERRATQTTRFAASARKAIIQS
jgi:hypothetical protein